MLTVLHQSRTKPPIILLGPSNLDPGGAYIMKGSIMVRPNRILSNSNIPVFSSQKVTRSIASSMAATVCFAIPVPVATSSEPSE